MRKKPCKKSNRSSGSDSGGAGWPGRAEAKTFSELFETEETTEGLTAFVEKRPPKY